MLTGSVGYIDSLFLCRLLDLCDSKTPKQLKNNPALREEIQGKILLAKCMYYGALFCHVKVIVLISEHQN